MSLTDTFVIWRAERTVRQAARRERRLLVQELATYDTQAQRDDLMAIFDQYPDEVTTRYREALFRQTVRGQGTRDWPAFRIGRP